MGLPFTVSHIPHPMAQQDHSTFHHIVMVCRIVETEYQTENKSRKDNKPTHFTITSLLPSPPLLTTQPCSVVTVPRAAVSPCPAAGSSSARTYTVSPSARTLDGSSACPRVCRRSSSEPEALGSHTECLTTATDRKAGRVTHVPHTHSPITCTQASLQGPAHTRTHLNLPHCEVKEGLVVAYRYQTLWSLASHGCAQPSIELQHDQLVQKTLHFGGLDLRDGRVGMDLHEGHTTGPSWRGSCVAQPLCM